MIDFNKGKELLNKFGGSESKTTVKYNDTVYMIKFPDPVRAKNNALSYITAEVTAVCVCDALNTSFKMLCARTTSAI
jgi:hypothetical protein